MEIFERCQQILNRRYIIEKDSYRAGDEILKELGRHIQTVQIKSGKTMAEFLVYGNHALYTKTVTYHRKSQIATNQFDIMKKCTTVKASKIHVKAFLNNSNYQNYILAINIGNLQHDMAIFVKKGMNGGYNFIHYDPNWGSTSQIVTAFIHQFGSKCTRSGYHSGDGNGKGMCTQLSWTEILKFMLRCETPFDRIDLKRFCSRTKAYHSVEEYDQIMEKTRERGRLYDSTRRLK